MDKALIIRTHNIQAHHDIDEDMGRKQNGLFTFVILVNCGNIVSYVQLESKNAKDYFNQPGTGSAGKVS